MGERGERWGNWGGWWESFLSSTGFHDNLAKFFLFTLPTTNKSFRTVQLARSRASQCQAGQWTNIPYALSARGLPRPASRLPSPSPGWRPRDPPHPFLLLSSPPASPHHRPPTAGHPCPASRLPGPRPKWIPLAGARAPWWDSRVSPASAHAHAAEPGRARAGERCPGRASSPESHHFLVVARPAPRALQSPAASPFPPPLPPRLFTSLSAFSFPPWLPSASALFPQTT